MSRPVARGEVGGVVRPPPVAHPKDFVPPFSNFVPPFSNFVSPFSNFVPPFSNFVPPFSNFVPPFSNFVPPLEYVDDVTRAMSKGGGVLVNVQEWGRFSNWWRHTGNVQGGGGACECPRVGAFFKLMTSRGQCPRGGCAWSSTHPSSDPPHLAGWLRAWWVCTKSHTLGVHWGRTPWDSLPTSEGYRLLWLCLSPLLMFTRDPGTPYSGLLEGRDVDHLVNTLYRLVVCHRTDRRRRKISLSLSGSFTPSRHLRPSSGREHIIV